MCMLNLLELKHQKSLCHTAFEKFIYLDTGEDKDKALALYKDSEMFWIEDKPANAEVVLH